MIISATWYFLAAARRVCTYEHLIYFQETRVLHTADMRLTYELHSIRAHHLHYTSLLEDYHKHVKFIQETKNPMLDSFMPVDKKFTQEILRRECENLSAEINRLKDQLHMQERRLKNVMGLVNFLCLDNINIGH
jgi:hypothetical protein